MRLLETVDSSKDNPAKPMCTILKVVSDNIKSARNSNAGEVPMFVCPDCKGKLDDLQCSCSKKYIRHNDIAGTAAAAALSLEDRSLSYPMVSELHASHGWTAPSIRHFSQWSSSGCEIDSQ
jgi:hypothetical protein